MIRLRIQFIRRCVVFLASALLLGVTGCTRDKEPEPIVSSQVKVTVWHYYNGAQKEIFDNMVDEFNQIVGKESGVIVEAVSKGTIGQLEQAVRDSMSGKVGAENLPNLLSAYSDMAYEVDQAGKAVDLKLYFTDAELSEYMDSYISEGEFGEEKSLKLFPIAKSTEVFALNWTDWELFAKETGASEKAFATWEGIAELAESYYNWTDDGTEADDDGKAFFGRDAFANYIIIGSLQLGHEICRTEDGKVELDFDRDTMRRLWDNYYIPYINGYYASYGKFRSDDVKTGDLLAFVGSNSGVTYFPSTVTFEDGSSHEIECRVYPLPNFENTSPYAVQQGAGMLMLPSDEATQRATAQFLKWFTDDDQNLKFAVNSGYLPVKRSVNDWSKAETEVAEQELHMPVTDLMKMSLHTGIDIVNSSQLYTAQPFAGGNSVRGILSSAMDQKARDDRNAVLKLMKSGMNRVEAVSLYDTDENFESWYEDTKIQLKAVGEKYDW